MGLVSDGPIIPLDDLSVRELGNFLLGSQFTEEMIGSLLRGIYAGNISNLSARCCFEPLWKLRQMDGFLPIFKLLLQPKQQEQASMESTTDLLRINHEIRKSMMFSFSRGVQTLTDTLYQHLLEGPSAFVPIRVRKGVAAKSITPTGDKQGPLQIELEDGEVMGADYVVSSLRCADFASLLPPPSFSSSSSSSAAHLHELRQRLIQEFAAPMAVVNIEIPYSASGPRLPEGIGYLTQPSSSSSVLGVLFDHQIFPGQRISADHSSHSPLRLSVMLGGDPSASPATINLLDRDVAFSDRTKALLESTALSSLSHHLRQPLVDPSFIKTTVWHNAIPQYSTGYKERASQIRHSTDLFFGSSLLSSMSRVSHIGTFDAVSVIDCVSSSHRLAQTFLQNLDQELF